MLNAFGLCAHQERNTQQYVRREFAQYEHEPVRQHEAFVVDLLIDVPDSGDTRHQRAWIQYCQQS